MKTKLSLLLLSLCFFTTLTVASNQIFHYRPKIVNLTGVIKLKTFSGLPNYESIEKGDETETYPCLFLDHSIDVVTSTSDDESAESETEKNLKIIQIAADEESSNWSWSRKKYIGKHVRITGTLYHSFTGHHHTRVLIDAKHFEIVK